MASMANTRVKKEISEIVKDKQCKDMVITVPDERNILHLACEISGTEGTPYEGGKYALDIVIPSQYPFSPPVIKFVTRIWHPNISSQTGVICLDILKDQWAAAMTLRTVMLSIQALLAAPEPDDPQDAVVAQQYKQNQPEFIRTARHWAQAYANAPGGAESSQEADMIKRLVDMGFSEADSRSALSGKNWNVEQAIEYLFR